MEVDGVKFMEFRGQPWFVKRVKTSLSDCPTCGRPNNIYTRKLSTSMAAGLIRLYRLHEDHPDQTYFHVKKFDLEGARGEFGVLSFWDLVEEAPNDDPEKKSSGLWRLTDFGREFVLGKTRVPKYVIIKWGSTFMGYCGEAVGIRSSLEYGNRFSYAELMGFKKEKV